MAELFDYVKSISNKDYIDEVSNYNPYITNTSLSYFLDTVMFANEMNLYHSLPPSCQYDFLFHTVRKGRRFSKWYKPEKDERVEMIMKFYDYSRPKALVALQVLTEDQINDIIRRVKETE